LAGNGFRPGVGGYPPPVGPRWALGQE